MLPKPTVNFVTNGQEPSMPEDVRGIVSNPIYCGIGPFPRVVDDEAFVSSCAKLIKEEGAEQFLVNMLYLLRESFKPEIHDSGEVVDHSADDPSPGSGKTDGAR